MKEEDEERHSFLRHDRHTHQSRRWRFGFTWSLVTHLYLAAIHNAVFLTACCNNESRVWGKPGPTTFSHCFPASLDKRFLQAEKTIHHKPVSTNLKLIPADSIQKLDLRFAPTFFHNLNNNRSAGLPPLPQIGPAWQTLLSPMNMLVSDEELMSSGQTSVPLPEGGGSFAWLGVSHEMHCIGRVTSSTCLRHGEE